MKAIRHSGIVLSLILTVFLISGFISDMQSTVTVTTVRTNMVKTTTASCSITVTGTPVSEMGACCWTQPNPIVSQKKFILPSGSKNGTPVMMTGLKPNTKYYVRAYAKSGTEIIYGNELSFTTLAASSEKNSDFGKKHEEKASGSK